MKYQILKGTTVRHIRQVSLGVTALFILCALLTHLMSLFWLSELCGVAAYMACVISVILVVTDELSK